MTTISKSARAMYMAHNIYKERAKERPTMAKPEPKTEWICALKRAWYFIRFQEWLAGSILKFSFWKKDNTIRETLATRDLRIIPADKWPKGTAVDRKPNYSAIAFFDLDKQEWRSFDITRFIGFVTIYELKERA